MKKKIILLVIILSISASGLFFMAMHISNMRTVEANGNELYENGDNVIADIVRSICRRSELGEREIHYKNILSSYDEFKYYFSTSRRFIPILEKYDSDFFDDNSMVIIGVISISAHPITNVKAIVVNDTVKLSYVTHAGFTSWHNDNFLIIAKIPKNVNEIIVEETRSNRRPTETERADVMNYIR